ncbi:ABC transporter permease [Acidisoma silvae]|uniref:ABC transporter permease n=1 Tax=Acidisoma silvae TaxID=2802396 RepID=A0A963YST4_9PROT|nr:ABC transporter permease [Acidisoma silvae]
MAGRKVPVTAYIGGIIVLLAVIMILFAPWIAPYPQTKIVGGVWDLPNAKDWLGTDSIGRDMLSRLIYGGRTSVSIALIATCLTMIIGVGLGFVAASTNKLVDNVISRIVDVLLAMPILIFGLMVFAVLGTSIPIMIITIAVLESTRVFRLARAVAMNITVMDYVQVARLRGEGIGWVIFREILPNALPPLVAEFGLRFCFTFLFIASLSFLGLGIQPPAADWGSMVHDNAQAISFGGFAPLFPAGAIAVVTIGVNLVVDWLLSIHALPAGAGAEI